MNVLDTPLPGVKLIELNVFCDERGRFFETFHARRYREMLGVAAEFVQDNCSHSVRNVIRGLHFQARRPQGKLVRAVHGEVFDVAVDVRAASPTFGQWHGSLLSGATHRQVWIPPGFAHGFAVLSETATLEYKCTEFYLPEDEVCLRWNDPALAIDWPVTCPVLSSKDQQGLGLHELRAAGRLPVMPLGPDAA